jgi:hypothetical protein
MQNLIINITEINTIKNEPTLAPIIIPILTESSLGTFGGNNYCYDYEVEVLLVLLA